MPKTYHVKFVYYTIKSFNFSGKLIFEFLKCLKVSNEENLTTNFKCRIVSNVKMKGFTEIYTSTT